MMAYLKNTIRSLINKAGYDINKIRNDVPDRIYHDLYPKESLENKRFYNIGAGNFRHKYWTNIEYHSNWYNYDNNLLDINYDLFSIKPLPIETKSAEAVYSSHTIEHINNEAAQNMFNEAFRILKPNGYLRLTTVNINLDYRAYKDNDRAYFYWIEEYSKKINWKRVNYIKPLNKASIEQVFLAHFATSVSELHADGAKERINDRELVSIFEEKEYEEALNYITSKCPIEIQKKYPGNHMNWWNYKKLSAMLKKAGFDKIYLSGYGQSYSPILRDLSLFDNTRPKNSLYVEAIK